VAKTSRQVAVTKAQREAARFVLERSERTGSSGSVAIRKIAQAKPAMNGSPS
jgi:hypothetical protein